MARLKASEVSAEAKAEIATPARMIVTIDGVLARQQIEKAEACKRAGDAADRHHYRRARREAEIEDEHRAQSRAARCADEAGFSERIAQQALEARAGEAEGRADDEAEQCARQAHLIEDQPGEGAVDFIDGVQLREEQFAAATDIDRGDEEETCERRKPEIDQRVVRRAAHQFVLATSNASRAMASRSAISVMKGVPQVQSLAGKSIARAYRAT